MQGRVIFVVGVSLVLLVVILTTLSSIWQTTEVPEDKSEAIISQIRKLNDDQEAISTLLADLLLLSKIQRSKNTNEEIIKILTEQIQKLGSEGEKEEEPCNEPPTKLSSPKPNKNQEKIEESYKTNRKINLEKKVEWDVRQVSADSFVTVTNAFTHKVLYWETIYKVGEFEPPKKVDSVLHNFEEAEFAVFESFSKLYLNVSITEFHRIDTFFQKVITNPQVGNSYYLDVSVKALAGKSAFCKSCKAVLAVTMPIYIQESPPAQFNVPAVSIRPYNEDSIVNFITVTSKAGAAFTKQLKSFTKMYEVDQNIRWIVINYSTDDIDYEAALHESQVPHIYRYIDKPYDRESGYNIAMDLVKNDDEFLFFMDVDIAFRPNFASVVRNRVFPGKQVFYPVIYSYSYAGAPPDMVYGLYHEKDLSNVGISKKDSLNYRWKKVEGPPAEEDPNNEDKAFYDAVSNDLFVFRNYEPGFFHLFHTPRV